nr:hypothetical protein [Tanacetum cinerariifolium]
MLLVPKNRPAILNKDNYVPWYSRLLHYVKSKPNEKLLVNSIKNGPYVRQIIHELDDPNIVPTVAKSTHEHTDDELTEKEVKRMEIFMLLVPKNHPAILNKDNYVPWYSRLLHYVKSKPNEKLLVNSIKNGPYVRRIIHELDDPNIVPTVAKSTHEHTDDELTEKEAIQTILMRLLEDIYATVDSCDTAQEIWLCVEQMMKGSNIEVILLGTAQSDQGKRDINKIEEVNANYILMANLQQASTSGTQTDKAPIYDLDGSAEPKQTRNATWYKDKAMLAKAQEAGQSLDEEQLAFLAYPGVPDGQAVQTIIPNNAAFQIEDLDTYDSDCDDISNAKAVIMANISNYGSDVIS